ncbi:hypothetical protein PR048_021178 [Dryococelus australis]|uniref:Uncharacterized protein n=1 Tax=Dryococelus australis TaxID=614101 RepID=A0ABQ9GXI6_9NEOP|nr:hypothetical protein PR048_021178 [Dryococelus australis]
MLSSGVHHSCDMLSSGVHHSCDMLSSGVHHSCDMLSSGVHHSCDMLSSGVHHSCDIGLTTRLPPRRTWFDSRRGHSWDFTCGTFPRVGGFLGDLPFAPPLHSDAAPYSPYFTLIGFEEPIFYSTGKFLTRATPECTAVPSDIPDQYQGNTRIIGDFSPHHDGASSGGVSLIREVRMYNVHSTSVLEFCILPYPEQKWIRNLRRCISIPQLSMPPDCYKSANEVPYVRA